MRAIAPAVVRAHASDGAATTLTLGLDIGGTKLAAGVVDATGHIVALMRTATPAGWQPAVAALLRLGHEVLHRAGVTTAGISAVGIGCGGPLDLGRGLVLAPPNLPGWNEVPIVQLVEQEFGRPTRLENDGNAAALATYRWGAHAGTDILVYFTISTGIGSGLVERGRLYRGGAGNGCELGHTVVDWRGRQCLCGQRGCAEAYVSGSSIGRRAREALAAGRSSALAGTAATAADVAAAARAGDSLALEIWTESTAILGRLLASTLNTFEPHLIVLGGGVTRAGDMLLEPVRATALAQAMPPAARIADIVLSSHGDNIGVVGAAAVAIPTVREEAP